jgi:hypothetical protein
MGHKTTSDVAPVNIIVPPAPRDKPDPGNPSKVLPVLEVDLYLWKREHNKAQDRKDKYDKNMAKAYIFIYHQCSPTLKNDLKALITFSAIRSNQDVIALLKLVQSFCCSYNAKTQSVMATVASNKRLFTYYQRDRVDNHTYHREFLAHVETLKTYRGLGVVGVVPIFLDAKIKELAATGSIVNAAAPTDAKRALAISTVREEYLTALMLSGAHRDCFSDLQTDLKNQYGYGDNCYPKTVDTCLSLLNRWTPSSQQKTPCQQCPQNDQAKEKDDDEALVFAQNTNSGSNRSSTASTDNSTKSKPPKSMPQKKPTNI